MTFDISRLNVPDGVDPDEFVNSLLEQAEQAAAAIFEANSKPADPRSDFQIVPAYVFDLDGTIRYSKSGAKFIQDASDVAVFPDVEPMLWGLRDSGALIQVASNQGGVAYGFRTPEQIDAELEATLAQFERDPFHEIVACYSHPKGKLFPYNHFSLLRKPAYGMLVMLETHARSHGFIIDWAKSCVVGDRNEDRDMAQAAGVPFKWAWDFFGRPNPNETLTDNGN